MHNIVVEHTSYEGEEKRKKKNMDEYKKTPKFLDFVFCFFLNHKYFIGN